MKVTFPGSSTPEIDGAGPPAVAAAVQLDTKESKSGSLRVDCRFTDWPAVIVTLPAGLSIATEGALFTSVILIVDVKFVVAVPSVTENTGEYDPDCVKLGVHEKVLVDELNVDPDGRPDAE